MKLDVFYFRRFKGLDGKLCKICRNKLSQTFQVTFDARPNDEWEMSAKCTKCGEDYTGMAAILNALGVPGPSSIKDINKRLG